MPWGAAAAHVQSLAQELPCATGVAKKISLMKQLIKFNTFYVTLFVSLILALSRMNK